MKRLVLLAGALVVSTAAQAQDSEFKHNGEFRVRYYNDMTPSGDKNIPLNTSDVEGRATIGLTMRKGENVQAHVSLIHGTIFGADKEASELPGTAGYTTATTNNLMLVNQAYGWWKAADGLTFKVGRQHVVVADGSVFSTDSWRLIPHTHEGLLVGYDTDFASFSLYLIKDAELSQTGNSPDSDPERNNTILSVDLKNMPEAVKTANVHILQSKGSETKVGTARGTLDIMHIGATVGGETSNISYKVTAAMQSGSLSKVSGSPVTETKLDTSMFDVMVGYAMPETMGLKLSAAYHMDSGDDATAATAADGGNADDNKTSTYQTLYYDSHKYAGLMDILGWGNLTYWNINASVMPAEDLEVGLGLYGFTKSKESGAINQTSRPGGQVAGAAANKADLGMELDVYATKKYAGGFQIDAHLGAFMPGSAFKDADPKVEATIMQVGLMGTMTF